MLKLFDSHTHVGHSKFDKDREETIGRAFDAGIGIIEVGNDIKSSLVAVKLAKKYSGKMWATVGCHPHDIDEFNYDFFKKLAQEPEVVAIGECGLDYYNRFKIYDLRFKNKQQEIFEQHIKLAKEINKPLMIHCRDAFLDLIEILNFKFQILNSPPGIIHFFTGSLSDAKKLLEMGFYFTFNGLITFNRDFDEIIKHIPLDRILLETDAPYVAPIPYRGQRNESAYIIETAKKMAEIKDVSLEKICEQTTGNVKKSFQRSLISYNLVEFCYGLCYYYKNPHNGVFLNG